MKLSFYKNRQALLSAEVVRHINAPSNIKEFHAVFSFNPKSSTLTMQLFLKAVQKSIRVYAQQTTTGAVYNLMFCPTEAFRAVGINAESLIGEKLDVCSTDVKWKYTVSIPPLDDISKQTIIRRRVKDILKKLPAMDRKYVALYLKPEAYSEG